MSFILLGMNDLERYTWLPNLTPRLALFFEKRNQLGDRLLGCEVELHLLRTFGVLLSP